MAAPPGDSNDADKAKDDVDAATTRRLASSASTVPGAKLDTKHSSSNSQHSEAVAEQHEQKRRKWPFNRKNKPSANARSQDAQASAEPDLSNLTEHQEQIVTRQTFTAKQKPISYL
ncbi:hypothetical protein ACM66B_002253 [Microbotryomycetes sp. NB124-2]